jgi:hypothetical protein
MAVAWPKARRKAREEQEEEEEEESPGQSYTDRSTIAILRELPWLLVTLLSHTPPPGNDV